MKFHTYKYRALSSCGIRQGYLQSFMLHLLLLLVTLLNNTISYESGMTCFKTVFF